MPIEIYKRPKEIESRTTTIKLEGCGNLHMTIGFHDSIESRVVEVRLHIGKSGVCANILLESWAKTMSALLMSPLPRYRIVEHLKRNHIGVSCSNEKESCVSRVASALVKELE